MISITNLEIGYRRKLQNLSVFKHITLSLFAGDLVGLIGDNGIGKSTLLQTITGNLPPLNGDITIAEKTINDYSILELAQLISIVTTEKVSGFNLSVWDVVAAGRTPYITIFGSLTDEDKTIITESLAALNILQLKETLMDELSDGQRQKVMIAKSLAQQTPIIVLDEPTAFLDYNSKHQLFSILKTLCEQQHKLIIVSSHDLDLMKHYTTKSMVMKVVNVLELIT